MDAKSLHILRECIMIIRLDIEHLQRVKPSQLLDDMAAAADRAIAELREGTG